MEPELMLRRLRDEDERWDGVQYVAPERQRSPWRGLSIAVAAGLLIGIVVVAGVLGVRGDRDVPPSVDVSSPVASSPVPTGPTSPPATGYVDGAGVDNEYKWEAEHFPRPLPSGYTYATPMFSNSSNGFEIGYGAVMVASYWVCAWEGAYLTATDAGDESAQNAAMAQIDAFETLPIVKSNFPDWDVQYDLYVAPAKSGNAEPMREALAGDSCPVLQKG